jgi:hypothetical protein
MTVRQEWNAQGVALQSLRAHAEDPHAVTMATLFLALLVKHRPTLLRQLAAGVPPLPQGGAGAEAAPLLHAADIIGPAVAAHTAEPRLQEVGHRLLAGLRAAR